MRNSLSSKVSVQFCIPISNEGEFLLYHIFCCQCFGFGEGKREILMAESRRLTGRWDVRCEESRITERFFFPWGDGRIELYVVKWKTVGNLVLGEGQEFTCGWVKFEILGRYLMNMLRYRVGHADMAFREEIWDRDIHLGVIVLVNSIWHHKTGWYHQ